MVARGSFNELHITRRMVPNNNYAVGFSKHMSLVLASVLYLTSYPLISKSFVCTRNDDVTINKVLYNRDFLAYVMVVILCICNDDVIGAGVELRGEVWPGTVLCFYPGTLVSFYCVRTREI